MQNTFLKVLFIFTLRCDSYHIKCIKRQFIHFLSIRMNDWKTIILYINKIILSFKTQ
jgi:hypothetical protein